MNLKEKAQLRHVRALQKSAQSAHEERGQARLPDLEIPVFRDCFHVESLSASDNNSTLISS